MRSLLAYTAQNRGDFVHIEHCVYPVSPGLHEEEERRLKRYSHELHKCSIEMQVNSKIKWAHKRSSSSKLVCQLLQVKQTGRDAFIVSPEMGKATQ